MQHTTEDLSPVKKKLTITVPVEEVNAALSATVAMYRTSISIDGFRKGKVPAGLIEKRFQDTIYQEATTDLVNVHINEIVTGNDYKPVSRIEFDGGQLERDAEFVYSISFEVMPEFEMPALEGIAIEQEEAIVDEDEVLGVVNRLRESMAEVKTLETPRKPVKGDIAVLDFAAEDENGPVAGISANDFSMPLGEGQTLEDFENLIMSLAPGESGEGPVAFPADFFNPEFAGKTLTMKATLKEVKERILPELDEKFAEKAGKFATVDALKDSIRESYLKSKSDLHKSAAQKTLLDGLLEKLDFPLPESMVKGHVDTLVGELEDKLMRQGKGIESTGKTLEEHREAAREEAEMRSRTHVFLFTAAQKLEQEVSEQEVDLHLRRMAAQSREIDYNTLKDYYTKNNLLFALRDRLLCDKAMDAIYEKATITYVQPKDGKKAEAGEAAAE